MKVYPETHRAD